MLRHPLQFSVFLILYQVLIILVTVDGKRNSDSEKPFTLENENDLQACLDNFDIHTDKIIRTQDSRAMGAKYINERDVSSREDCLKLCCETENCDVFVFEEKNPGSCYLFECGSPEDFKCKFTKHKNYTSAVLAVSRHLTELESQIKFTQHEHELTKLREPIQVNSPVSQIIKTTTEVPLNKETLQLVPLERNHENQNHACSRFQFPCHSGGECIAIYNACDGILQCTDGSDEAPELGCPWQTTTSAKPTVVTVAPHPNALRSGGPETEGNGHINNNLPVHSQYQSNPADSQRQWNQQEQYTARKHTESEVGSANSFSGNSPHNLNQGANAQNARANYGREGEGMVYRPQQDQIWPYQYHSNSGGSQIFAHKGNGLVQQNERYPQHPYDSAAGNGGQYNEHMQSDLMKYNYADGANYRVYPQNPQMNNNWDGIHKTHDLQGNAPDDTGNLNGDRGGVHNNILGQDYYYEDFYRRGQPPPQPLHRLQVQHSPPSHIQSIDLIRQEMNKPVEKPQVGEFSKVEMNNPKSVNSDINTHNPLLKSTTTPKAATQPPHIHSAHRKMEKLTAEVTLRETFSENEIDGHSSSPSGAILSLTFGLCITGIMVVLVGCRMRMVHRRMRRGGKSPYAHDADFLVNGMYL